MLPLSKSNFSALLLTLVYALFLFLSLLVPKNAFALTGSDWNAGNIIDDGVFYDNTSMSTGDIQNFLNSKVTCDTWGNKPSEYGGGTRAQYSASKGYSTPFYCLNNYSQDGKSSAQIIKEAADAYQLNPKVLIVTLQKEQTLVTDEWPWPTQYRSATGYACPDTAACDSQYFGFYNQVRNTARQFRLYANNPQNYTKRANQNNYIQYNPVESCGGSNVFIANKATAGLYNYTPYQPNSSALNNLYGTGDSCGAYGNRNFWRLFNDWFGSIRACDYGNSANKPQSLPYTKQSALTLPGNWTGWPYQGFAYATEEREGFSVGVMASTPSGLQWKGTWWRQTNNNINIHNTSFIPADANGDGQTDLYYATALDWSKPGFTVGLMLNTGSGFSYQGTKWYSSNLALGSTKFIPGKFSTSSNQGFAYATPERNGFSVGVMASSPGGLQWQGTWWRQTNDNISVNNTMFIPADVENDGRTDLYYASATDWGQGGFSMGLVSNTGSSFAYSGTKWSTNSLPLISTRFIPGNWNGPGNQGFAYATSCGSRGFDVATMKSFNNQLVWQGVKWNAPTLPFASTSFIPADADGDGRTDLYYATPSGGGFELALHKTNNDDSFSWQGVKWNASNLQLINTTFVP